MQELDSSQNDTEFQWKAPNWVRIALFIILCLQLPYQYGCRDGKMTSTSSSSRGRQGHCGMNESWLPEFLGRIFVAVQAGQNSTLRGVKTTPISVAMRNKKQRLEAVSGVHRSSQ
jgi:hypothetical protein